MSFFASCLLLELTPSWQILLNFMDSAPDLLLLIVYLGFMPLFDKSQILPRVFPEHASLAKSKQD